MDSLWVSPAKKNSLFTSKLLYTPEHTFYIARPTSAKSLPFIASEMNNLLSVPYESRYKLLYAKDKKKWNYSRRKLSKEVKNHIFEQGIDYLLFDLTGTPFPQELKIAEQKIFSEYIFPSYKDVRDRINVLSFPYWGERVDEYNKKERSMFSWNLIHNEFDVPHLFLLGYTAFFKDCQHLIENVSPLSFEKSLSPSLGHLLESIPKRKQKKKEEAKLRESLHEGQD